MTEKQRMVIQGLLDGKGYAEIAREQGITRQAAFLRARQAIALRGNGKYEHYYPNLSGYLRDNNIGIYEFARDSKICYATLHKMFVNGARPSWRTIDKLCDYTGMAPEVLMVREDV